MLIENKNKDLLKFQVQKFNVSLSLIVENDNNYKLRCVQADFIQKLINVFEIFKYEGYMEFVGLVNDKQEAGYQDYTIYFEDDVVQYYLGAPAGQVSESLFFEILAYFLITINETKVAREVLAKHLSGSPELASIEANMESMESRITKSQI